MIQHRSIGQVNFKDWLDLYARAWRNLDPELIEKLFVDDATYQEKPFDPPLRCIDAIRKYWKGVAQTQEDVQFDYQILSVTNEQGIAHWKASFFRNVDQNHVRLDGIMLVNLNSEGKCTSFREWWQSQKTKQA